jgi:transcription factor SFP1
VDRLSEVERDKRMRPFVCKVGTECNRRYKNMNGLRYHYTHTGEHGQVGLDMLNHGVHPLPDCGSTGHSRSGSKSAGSSAASTPVGTPTPTQTEFPRTNFFSSSAQGGLGGVSSVMSTISLPTPAVVPAPATTATTTATATMQGSSQLQQAQPQQRQPQPQPPSQLHQFWVKEEMGMVL